MTTKTDQTLLSGVGSIDLIVQMKIVQRDTGRSPDTRRIELSHPRVIMRKTKIIRVLSLKQRRSMMRDWKGRKMNGVKLNVRRNWKGSGSSMPMLHKAQTVCASKVGLDTSYFLALHRSDSRSYRSWEDEVC
jgi:hypothetical protein